MATGGGCGRERRGGRSGYSQGGRWSKFPPFAQPVENGERAEHWAWLLLHRYGVMFRDLLARESLAPTWRELLRVYRRLEMRGEIRGGRFVGGVAGEQFALPEAVEQLRKHRDEPSTENWSVISAADPLNLVGIVTVGVRVPALRSNRVVFLNGRPIAAREARSIRWSADVDDATRQQAERLLTAPGALSRETRRERMVEWSEVFEDELRGQTGWYLIAPRAPTRPFIGSVALATWLGTPARNRLAAGFGHCYAFEFCDRRRAGKAGALVVAPDDVVGGVNRAVAVAVGGWGCGADVLPPDVVVGGIDDAVVVVVAGERDPMRATAAVADQDPCRAPSTPAAAT